MTSWRGAREPDRTLAGTAADVWRRTLSQIPSVFGRLVYPSSLRDPNTGNYEHHGLALMFGDQDAHGAVAQSHAAAFLEWLCFTLEQQKADLDLYLSDLGTGRRVVVETWLKLTPHRNLIPAGAKEMEKRLYLADLEALLELLKNEHDMAWPDPKS